MVAVLTILNCICSVLRKGLQLLIQAILKKCKPMIIRMIRKIFNTICMLLERRK